MKMGFARVTLLVLSGVALAMSATISYHGYREPSQRSFAYPQRSSRSKMAISRIDTTDKVVALTFDDGPDPRFTPRILEILKSKGVKATFFVTGSNAREYPEILKRVASERHTIGNHSWSHLHMAELSFDKIKEELSETADEIALVTGDYPVFARPPYGESNPEVHKAIGKCGYRVILWSSSFEELRFPGAEEDARYVADHIKPGDIILGHDGRMPYRNRGVKALSFLIDLLKAKGYRFVTIDEVESL